MTPEEVRDAIETAYSAVFNRCLERELDEAYAARDGVLAYITALEGIASAVADTDDTEIYDRCDHCHADQGYMVLTHTADCPVTLARQWRNQQTAKQTETHEL